MRAINTTGISKRVRIPQTLKFKAFVRSQHPTVAMAMIDEKMIFEKTVEQPDIRNKLKLPFDSNWGELPSEGPKLEVKDQDNKPWKFDYSKSADNKADLSGERWKAFVTNQKIKAGNKISLYKTGELYTIKVKK
ncbi:hypothetical protein SLE2022_040200 [Rubroshorea leprosula]